MVCYEEFSFSSSLFRLEIIGYTLYPRYFQFFLISTIRQEASPFRAGTFSSSLFRLEHIGYITWYCYYFQFFLISTRKSYNRLWKKKLSVLPYFDRVITFKIEDDLSFSSSLFRLGIKKISIQEANFQFFLISTNTILKSLYYFDLSVLPYFDFIYHSISRQISSFQFFLISTTVSKPCISTWRLSVLPYFD